MSIYNQDSNAQYPYPSPGYWNMIGTLDGQNEFPRKVLTGVDAQYQSLYDAGYDEGAKEAPQLDDFPVRPDATNLP